MQNGNRKGNGQGPRYECVARLGIRNTCVYLASNDGDDPTFSEAVDEFGEILAVNRTRLICGGGGRGLMRRLVLAVINHGGSVIAITPKSLYDKEGRADLPHTIDVSELTDFRQVLEVVRGQLVTIHGSVQIIVSNMGIRKSLMYELADAFVALPGGIGTLEELVEQLTWRQLGHHSKPIGIYNHRGFWDPLLEVFHRMRQRRLITLEQPIEYAVAHTVPQILPVMCGEMESCGRLRKRPFDDELFGVGGETAANPANKTVG